MSDCSVAGALRLSEERALLRIARDHHHIDADTGRLSNARINLADLCGKPVTREQTKQRSLSTYMLCSQDIDAVRETARSAAKEPSADFEPKGAAALLENLTAIDSSGEPALRIEEEAEKDGWPAAGSMDTEFSVPRPTPRNP